MKIIHKDIRHGELKVKVESTEDIWYLSSIIEPDDLVYGTTERKIKIGGSEDKSKISRRMVFLKIKVEKVDYDTQELRVSGIITEAPEDIPRGDYHTFSIISQTIIGIQKEYWSKYLLKKLDEAIKGDTVNILLVAFDREEAIFAGLKNSGHEILLELKGDVSKKDFEEKKGNFYQEIYAQIKSYDEKHNYSNIILASPAFWKEYLMKEVKDDAIKKKITLATCSSIDESTINEIMKRPELKTVLDKDKSSRELKLLDELLANIRKENAAYGIDSVKEKMIAGNVSTLLLSENLIKTLRSKKDISYRKIEELMTLAETLNADIRIISSEDAAKKLDGLSGIACLFRWKEQYGQE